MFSFPTLFPLVNYSFSLLAMAIPLSLVLVSLLIYPIATSTAPIVAFIMPHYKCTCIFG